MSEKKWEDYDTIVCSDGEVIDMKKCVEEQELAKASLSHLEPFFAAMINKIRFVYTFKVDTQATDGYNIFVNPQFTSHLTFEEKVMVLAHEMMHNILNHLRRRDARGDEPLKSNYAADYEVNSTLVRMDITTPSIIDHAHGLFDRKWDDKGYEEIYDNIPNPPEPPDPPKPPADFVAGLRQAIEDWKNGTLKIDV